MPFDKDVRNDFQGALKHAIMTCLPELVAAKNAGPMRWFNLLVSSTSTQNSQRDIGKSCLQLLLSVANEMAARWNPYTSVLRTRFGLYGLPFEPDLFDAELPLSSKLTAAPGSLSSILKNAASAQNSVIDLKKFCSGGKRCVESCFVEKIHLTKHILFI